ncbi:MAG: energy-coupling factor transporter ATPase [Lachnospiraceae bacterium]|nr:energy-coupling factor transporter ATPase [Lachnospiraceae bacterium]
MSIRAEHLTHLYSPGTAFESFALNDVSFEIPSGSFVAVIGHTGSGKSTLVQHLNGLYKPTSGTVYFNGEDIFAEGYDLKKLRTKVGLVFQYPEYQLFEENVIKDVMFGPLNMGLSKEEAEEKAKKALRQVRMSEELYERSPFDLSGGQKRRVAIAGVLAMDPEVLILDEPTAGLDPRGRNYILGMLEELHRERGITIILVSHSMDDVAECADLLMVLKDAELKFFDKPKEVFKNVDELESYGLAVPEITYLAKELIEAGLDMDPTVSTVEEAKKELLRVLKRK